ncbi:hypothetical protein IHE55_06640 [Streptomyces pactum]|uniref:Uncharacterized protein n=1 Tax=Streptomyces pactum TaxID=68249 RepID=A0ABS0NH22_9ACTN|nr:DUF5988 family protein [Streptomyces pactum]MBH5334498.1 hypothetical protein [Streptomyces pactum]
MDTCQNDPAQTSGTDPATAAAPGNVILRGGPVNEPADAESVVTVPDTEQVLKLCKGSHYDHYLPTADWEVRSGHRLRVFRWSHRTRVAE